MQKEDKIEDSHLMSEQVHSSTSILPKYPVASVAIAIINPL